MRKQLGLERLVISTGRRDASLRRQLARAADRGMANIDADIFAAIMCEQCPDLELCAQKATSWIRKTP